MSCVLYIKWKKKRPSFAVIVDLKNGKNHCFKLWGSGESLFNIFEKEKKLVKLLEHLEKIAVVGYMRFIDYFGCLKAPLVYDLYYEDEKEIFKEVQRDYDEGLLFADWQILRAESAEAYKKIQDRKLLLEYKEVNPVYSNEVFSGRSKTSGFNVQGKGKDFSVAHSDSRYSLFLAFDWLSADARVGAYLSEDEELYGCFDESDPYTHISDALDGQIERSTCKIAWNRAVNSLDYENEIFILFPKFKEWLKKQISDLAKNGYTESIMGRRFRSDGSHKQNKRAINSIFQGSVAHAMQNTVIRIAEMTDGILTEQHDSITVCTTEYRMSKNVKDIIDIMFKPLGEYSDITMPLRVGLGKSWGSYKYFKECRQE